jgi:hypothetical protein
MRWIISVSKMLQSMQPATAFLFPLPVLKIHRLNLPETFLF